MISAVKRHKAAEEALNFLLYSPLFQSSEKIACYLAQKNEFDCMPMIQAIWQNQKECYLPVLSSDNTNFLHFYHYVATDTLQLNRYHILEPTSKKQIPSSQLDLVLVPLVGFDNNGNRLGMGGGFYDRTFMFLQEKSTKKPFLLGVAFEEQRVEEILHEPWDVQLNGILTERGLCFF